MIHECLVWPPLIRAHYSNNMCMPKNAAFKRRFSSVTCRRFCCCSLTPHIHRNLIRLHSIDRWLLIVIVIVFMKCSIRCINLLEISKKREKKTAKVVFSSASSSCAIVVVVWHLCKKLCKECTCGLCLHILHIIDLFKFRIVVYNELNFNRCNKLQFATLMHVRVCVCPQSIYACTSLCGAHRKLLGEQQQTNAKYGLAPESKNGPTEKKTSANRQLNMLSL